MLYSVCMLEPFLFDVSRNTTRITMCIIVYDWYSSAHRFCESVEYIEFALFVNKIYNCVCVCVLQYSCIHSFVSLFPFSFDVPTSNTYCYDLNRSFCTAAKCYLNVFMHVLFLLLRIAVVVSQCVPQCIIMGRDCLEIRACGQE